MRRSLTAGAMAVALLGAADAACADVFVPDDPAPHEAECVAAAGDVVVIARSDAPERATVELSEAGGPWRRVARRRDLRACPRVAAATDGTAVVDLGSRVLVRRPGAGFGAPVALPGGVFAEDLAAAPEGWVGVAGVRLRQDGSSDLVATILAPDGSRRSATVDRARSTRRVAERFLAPRIGIAMTGAATLAWTRWEAVSGRYTLRTAAADGTARTLAAGAAPKLDFPALGQADVAVAPGGRTLLAWADGRGVHASVDGGPAERLATQQTAGSPTASIAGDGSAVVAYGVRRTRVLVNERGADGSWTTPHALATDEVGPPSYGDPGTPHEVDLESVLAPDGRAAVAWEALGLVGGRVVAASRAAGGPWSAAAPVSLITRNGGVSTLSLAASGEPRLTWIETTVRGPADRLRAARLMAVEPDRTAPVLTTRLPARTGNLTIRIPVGCSEACDARVRLVDPRLGFELAGVGRELPAGETTIRLRTPRHVGREMLKRKSARRPRLEVIVTDRAGNVAREARRVTFRLAAGATAAAAY